MQPRPGGILPPESIAHIVRFPPTQPYPFLLGSAESFGGRHPILTANPLHFVELPAVVNAGTCKRYSRLGNGEGLWSRVGVGEVEGQGDGMHDKQQGGWSQFMLQVGVEGGDAHGWSVGERRAQCEVHGCATGSIS